jgi:hypothetical protein
LVRPETFGPYYVISDVVEEPPASIFRVIQEDYPEDKSRKLL